MSEDFKVTDTETKQWIDQLTDADKTELKRRALEKRAVEILQPNPPRPNFESMSDQDLERFKMENGFYNK